MAIKTPKDVKEYNEVYCTRIDNATLFVRQSMRHSLEKSGAKDVCLKYGEEFRTVYDEAKRQLAIVGWGPEMKQTLLDALTVYRKYLLDNIPKPRLTAEWEEDMANDYVPTCSNCGCASDVDGDELRRRGKIRYLYESECPQCGALMRNGQ